jgi:hypothetical protein
MTKAAEIKMKAVSPLFIFSYPPVLLRLLSARPVPSSGGLVFADKSSGFHQRKTERM